jgi:hypothetical protein
MAIPLSVNGDVRDATMRRPFEKRTARRDSLWLTRGLVGPRRKSVLCRQVVLPGLTGILL